MRDASEQEYVDYVTARIPALRRLAYLLAGDEHRADDLVQQTITTLYVKWRHARAADRLDAYVRTMLVRTYINERRLAWTRVRLFRDTPEPPPFEDGGVEDRQVVRAALSRVPRRQQAVLVLRFYYDLPVDEVAGMLGCSSGTVKSQTSRGLATLRRLLGERELAGFSATT
ncbi:SigE family RNA polymerase sigma factor [Micromonospora coxensis]|uniref:RNA polymerase sigma-70 factor, sigma-E family n=1 Tax=Micromonospora coxensis TaxID=356852 RepID=A0A1C5GMP7_9ACTN|nr:SigE family RNA polymerase sigma factor [Micromonospora coxensis]SCG34361.1 RNA polymerase sigma-70 factor, sigma-E family [Micromonospora coxensis]